MSNKETLQEYNERLGANNITLDSVLETINNLPEAGAGEGVIGQKYIYLIKDGIVQLENTGEYSYKMTNGDANVSVVQQDGYLGLCSRCWSDGTLTFANTFDLKRYSNVYIDFAYPSKSSPYAYNNATSIAYVGAEYTVLHNKGETTQRKTITIQVPEGTGTDTIKLVCSNLGDGSAYTSYPFQLFNLYIENPNVKVQDKEVEITENGVYNITKDDDYIALNSVEVTVDVESNLQDKDVEINENGVTTVTADEGFDGLNKVVVTVNVDSGEETERAYIIDNVDSSGNITELTIMGLNEIPKYFGLENPIFKKLKKVKLLEPATSIGLQAFNQATQLESVTLPSTLTTINAAAFLNCTSLILTELPESVTTLTGSSNFASSNVLLKKLPDNLKGTIPVAAFYDTPISIKKISDGVTTVEGRSFYSCDNIQQISMKNVTTMTDATQIGAFTECVNLKSVWIGSAISSMSDTTFKMCSNLNKIYIDKPRTTVEALTYYSTKWSGSTVSSTCEIICNDDVGFITQDEFDAIDWATYSE